MSDATPTLTRTVNDEVIPAPGVFTLDPAHSHVGFSVRHMMIAKVRGRFADFTGTLTLADDPFQSSVEVEVDLASIDTRDEQRDGHLRSPDFFDVEQYPKMTFRSTSVRINGGDSVRVDGELTLHGVTQPLVLDVVYDGVGQDPWGNQRMGLSATGEIDRDAFGLTWNQPLAQGGVLVGKAVRLEIEAEFVRQQGS
jgi:polyisoprenoid-binding protein YceI